MATACCTTTPVARLADHRTRPDGTSLRLAAAQVPDAGLGNLIRQGHQPHARRRGRPAPRAGGLLRRSAGADDQPARAPGGAVARHRPAVRDGRPGGERIGGERGAAERDQGRRVAARVPRGRAAAAARVPRGRAAAAAHVPAGDPGQPARLRYPPARPAGRPAAVHRRAARRGRRDPRPGPPDGRRPLAPDRGRRLRPAPGRAEDLGAPAGRGRRASDRPGARIPAAWRELASRRTGRRAPEFMTEGNEPAYARFESGYDPAEPFDQAIMATRAAVFPEHGMTPLP